MKQDNFGELLKARRQIAGKTQSEVATFIGKTVRQYQRYEDDTMPDAGVIFKLSEILGFNFEEWKGGGSLSIEEIAAYLIRLEAKATVTLEAVAEVLAAQKNLTSAQIRTSLESAVMEKERVLRLTHANSDA